MKTHIKKAELANKLIGVLHNKTDGDIFLWDKNHSGTKVKSGFTLSGYNKLTDKEKVGLFDFIYLEVKNTHSDIIRARHKRRKIRTRDAKRLAAGKVPKKRTTKAEWEAKQILKIA